MQVNDDVPNITFLQYIFRPGLHTDWTSIVMRQSQKIFTRPDSWKGGSVDALMYFGAAGIDEANAVSRAVWSYPGLEGPYRHDDVEPDQQVPIAVPEMSIHGHAGSIGVYTHHDGSRSAFEHSSLIDEDGLWVYAGPTVGGLPEDWDIGAYPFGDSNPNKWLLPLYDSLRALVMHVSQTMPPRAAIYSFCPEASRDVPIEAAEGNIPDDRWCPIDVWRDGQHSHYPMTRF